MSESDPETVDGRTPPTPTLKAIGWALLAIIGFTTVPIGVRFLAPHLPPPEIVVLRCCIAVALMGPWALRVGASGMRPKRLGLHVLRGLTNGIGMMLWFWGLARVAVVADAVALQYTLPLFASLLAVLFLGERVGVRRWSAMVVGFMGALVIVRPGFAEIGLPTAAVLGSAALYAATMVVMRSQSRAEDKWVIMFYSNLFIALVALAPALYVWVTPPPETWPWLLFVGLGGFLAHFSLSRALHFADTKTIAPFDYLRLPLVAFVALPLFGEFPDIFTWIGAAVIAASTAYIAHRDARLAARRARAGDEPVPPIP